MEAMVLKVFLENAPLTTDLFKLRGLSKGAKAVVHERICGIPWADFGYVATCMPEHMALKVCGWSNQLVPQESAVIRRKYCYVMDISDVGSLGDAALLEWYKSGTPLMPYHLVEIILGPYSRPADIFRSIIIRRAEPISLDVYTVNTTTYGCVGSMVRWILNYGNWSTFGFMSDTRHASHEIWVKRAVSNAKKAWPDMSISFD